MLVMPTLLSPLGKPSRQALWASPALLFDLRLSATQCQNSTRANFRTQTVDDKARNDDATDNM